MESLDGLLGLRRGIIIDVFQMSGKIPELMDRLNISVRNLIPFGPRCLRWREVRLSGPADLDGLQDLITSLVCSVVKDMGFSSLFFFICLDMVLDDLEVLC